MNNLVSDDWQEYIDQIFDRTHKLVNLNIWDPVSKQKLKAWTDCLAVHDAKLLGAYLLDNFCCRSREQFLSMFDILLYGLDVEGSKLELLDIIKNRPEGALINSIKIAPVIGLDQPPTKSGPYVLRLIQRRFRIHSDWLAWPNNLGDLTKIRQLYFVDDFCGTGSQFIDFANSIKLDDTHKKNPNINITYLVSTIHETGLIKIRKEKPYISLKFSDYLNQSHEVFSDACFSRYEVTNFKETC